MLILEGADAVGKTTMARKLCKTFVDKMGGVADDYYGHMSKPPDDFDHVAGYMRGVHAGVQDRYHLGSITYGKIIGGGNYPSARKMLIVQRYLRWQGCLTIVVHAHRQWLHEHLMGMPDRVEMYQHDQILDVNDAFAALARSNNRGEPYADEVIDVSDGWPDDARLTELFELWKARWLA